MSWPVGVESAAAAGASALALTHAPMGIAVIDADGIYRSVNPAHCTLYGWRADELVGRPFTMVVAPDRRASAMARHRLFMAGGQALDGEFQVQHRDGRSIDVLLHSVAVAGQDGRLMRLVYVLDITERKQAERTLQAQQQSLQAALDALRSSEERYRRLFETVAQGVVYQDAQGRITSANPAAQRILGRTLAQMQGEHGDDPGWQAQREDGSPLAAESHPAAVALRTGEPVSDVVMGVPVPGRGLAWLLVNATPLKRQGVVEEVYSSFEDITERVLLSRELHRQASTDDLTGVANRRSLMRRLGLEFERVRRSPGSHRCAVLAVDLDLFKQVNDNHGHAAGDAVLQQVAALMRRLTRQHDLVARSGGEEFMLLLPDASADDALALAERLRAGLHAQPLQHRGVLLAVTVSVGVSAILPGDAGVDAVLARADGALYAAKGAGRDRVCVAPLPG